MPEQTLTMYDSLFSLHTGPQLAVENQIIRVPLQELHPFHDHPFHVKDDADMEATVDSIKRKGVLVPGIVRIRPAGGYELVAGHRRKRGSELAGKTDMPVIVMDLDDDDATIIMVDTNIQRTDLLPSEKAYAYKMRLDAMKRKAGRSKDNQIHKRSDQILAELSGESRNTIQRYIRLTELIPELLDLVDAKKIQMIAGSDISYLQKSEQTRLLILIKEHSIYPNGEQAVRLKEYSRQGQLSDSVMRSVMLQAEKVSNRITLPNKTLQKYFPNHYNKKDMEQVIIQLLEQWKQEQG